jgi:hypothetical protein
MLRRRAIVILRSGSVRRSLVAPVIGIGTAVRNIVRIVRVVAIIRSTPRAVAVIRVCRPIGAPGKANVESPPVTETRAEKAATPTGEAATKATVEPSTVKPSDTAAKTSTMKAPASAMKAASATMTSTLSKCGLRRAREYD